MRPATQRQQDYLWRLKALTGDRAKPAQTFNEALREITRLKRRARKLGVPSYHYEPYPVRAYYDPSIIIDTAKGSEERTATDPWKLPLG